MESVAGILLAAGKSSRMGRMKQTLPFRGKTLLVHCVAQALRSNLEEVVLVLGHGFEEIKETIPDALLGEKLRIVENKDYAKGLSSSIITGLGVVEDRFNHVMILLADMPGVETKMINLLIARYLDSGLPLGAVSVGGRAVHPVIFSAGLYPEIRQLKGDVGARSILKANGEHICMVEPPGDYDYRDADTPEDYRNLLAV